MKRARVKNARVASAVAVAVAAPVGAVVTAAAAVVVTAVAVAAAEPEAAVLVGPVVAVVAAPTVVVVAVAVAARTAAVAAAVAAPVVAVAVAAVVTAVAAEAAAATDKPSPTPNTGSIRAFSGPCKKSATAPGLRAFLLGRAFSSTARWRQSLGRGRSAGPLPGTPVRTVVSTTRQNRSGRSTCTAAKYIVTL